MIEAAERSQSGGKPGRDSPGFPIQFDGALEEETCFVIVAQEWGLALAVIRSLPGKRPKFFVVGNESLRALGYSRSCRGYFALDFPLSNANVESFASILNAMRKSAGRNLLLIPVDEVAAKVVYSVADQLGLPAYPCSEPNVVDTLADKWRFAGLCEKIGLPNPPTINIGDRLDFEFERVASILGSQFVIKPTNLQRSIGVEVIGSPEEYDEKIRFNANYNFSPLIAQKYVPGSDVDISVFASEGKILNFAIQSHIGGRLHFLENDEIYKLAAKLAGALKYTGVVHLDGRFDAAGNFCFIEANPRFWGSLLAATWCGLNFIEAGISFIRDQPCVSPRTIANKSAQPLGAVLKSLVRRGTRFSELEPHQREVVKRILYDPVLLSPVLKMLACANVQLGRLGTRA